MGKKIHLGSILYYRWIIQIIIDGQIQKKRQT